MEEVDILECESLAVCDAYDGEINILGQQVSKDGSGVRGDCMKTGCQYTLPRT